MLASRRGSRNDSKFRYHDHGSCASLFQAGDPACPPPQLPLPASSPECSDTVCGWHREDLNLSQALVCSLSPAQISSWLCLRGLSAFLCWHQLESRQGPDSGRKHSSGSVSPSRPKSPSSSALSPGAHPRARTCIYLGTTCIYHVSVGHGCLTGLRDQVHYKRALPHTDIFFKG